MRPRTSSFSSNMPRSVGTSEPSFLGGDLPPQRNRAVGRPRTRGGTPGRCEVAGTSPRIAHPQAQGSLAADRCLPRRRPSYCSGGRRFHHRLVAERVGAGAEPDVRPALPVPEVVHAFEPRLGPVRYLVVDVAGICKQAQAASNMSAWRSGSGAGTAPAATFRPSGVAGSIVRAYALTCPGRARRLRSVRSQDASVSPCAP